MKTRMLLLTPLFAGLVLLLSILWTSKAFKHVGLLHHQSTYGTSTRSTTNLHSAPAPVPPATDDNDDLRQKLKGTSIYFVGMMGSGKSTVGKIIADKLGYRFLDTDEVAEYMIEMPISDFFAQGKVEQFRDVEYQVLMELAQYTRVVISTGGGIVERNMNWGEQFSSLCFKYSIIQYVVLLIGVMRNGLVIFLDMKPEDIYQRLSNNEKEMSKRPLLQGPDPLAKLVKLSEDRRDKYMQSDVVIPVTSDATPEAVANSVVARTLQFIRDNPPMWQQWKQKRESIAVDAGTF